MTAHAATVNDLHVLRQDIIREIKSLLSRHQVVFTTRWIKSREVKEVLSISAGTLIQMRLNGTLTCTKVGGVYYYDAQKIKDMLTGKKQSRSITPARKVQRG